MPQPTAHDRPASIAVHHLGQAFVLAEWKGPAVHSAGRLRVTINGSRIRPPYSQISLPREDATCRNLLAFRLDASSRLAPMEIRDTAGGLVGRFDGPTRAVPMAQDFDAHALVLGLDAGRRARLARFLLEVCGPLFRVSTDPLFVANLRTLLAEMAAGSGALTARCTLTAEQMFCEGSVPDTLGERLSAVLLSDEGVVRNPAPPVLLPAPASQPGRDGLGIVVPCSARRRGATVVIFGENGLVCRSVAAPRRRLPSAHEWFAKAARQRPQQRRYLLETLARGQSDIAAAALLDELRVLTADGERPADARSASLRVTAETIIDCGHGLFVSGRLIDPHRLVVGIDVERLGVIRSVSADRLARFAAVTSSDAGGETDRNGFAIFVAEPDDVAADAPVRLSVSLRSSERMDIGEGPALLTPEQACSAVLASVPPQGADESLLACIEQTLRALLGQRLATPMLFDIREVGRCPALPAATVIAPFTREQEILRCRLGVLAGDPEMRQAEFVYLVDRPEDQLAAERVLRDLWAAYGIASRLVVFERPAPAGAVLDIGARVARGAMLAFFGRTAVPEAAGWLSKLTRFLEARPQRGIVGAQSLHPDHSLISAGGVTGRDDQGLWRVHPILAGFPRDYAPAATASRVDAVSPECFVLARALLLEVRGFTGDYLLETSAVAELCLQAAARGREVWRLPEPAVFRLGAVAAEDEAQAAARRELDRRLLARRWCDALPAAAAAPSSERTAHRLSVPDVQANTTAQKAA